MEEIVMITSREPLFIAPNHDVSIIKESENYKPTGSVFLFHPRFNKSEQH